MTKTKPDMNTGLSWLEKILQLYKEYGVIGIIKGILILFILSITLRMCYNPTFIFDKYSDYIAKKHLIELNERSEYDQKLKSLLPVYLYKYRADRVWILQYHNGTRDWQHGTMRFELCNEGVESINHQYDNFNLTWLNMPYYLKEHEIFIGNTTELTEIDATLGTQFKKNKVQYLACVLIRDSSNYPIGIFGITWSEIPFNIEELKPKIHDYLILDRADVKALI